MKIKKVIDEMNFDYVKFRNKYLEYEVYIFFYKFLKLYYKNLI